MQRLFLFILIGILFPNFAMAGEIAMQADFNSFEVGSALTSSMPGDPAGDSFRVSIRIGSATVVASAGDLLDQPILFQRPGGTGGYFTQAIIDPAFGAERVFRLRWKSALISGSYFGITPRGQYSFRGIGYRLDGVLTYGSSDTPLQATWTAGVSQEFELLMDMNRNMTRLWVDGVEETIPQTFYNDPAGFDRLEFAPAGFAVEFAFDDVMITTESSGVALEETSWGDLKASYHE
jgi:hypothetical protein